MAPMGIRLSPLGMAVFCLLGLGVLYHLYSGFLAGRFAFFMLSEPAAGGPETPHGSVPGGAVDLRELLAVSVLAAVRGGEEVKRVREGNVLNAKAKGKTREGAEEQLTTGDLLSNRRMFYLLKGAFPAVQVGASVGRGLPGPGAGMLHTGAFPVRDRRRKALPSFALCLPLPLDLWQCHLTLVAVKGLGCRGRSWSVLQAKPREVKQYQTMGMEGWGKHRVSLLWIVGSVVTGTGDCTAQIPPTVEMQRLVMPLFLWLSFLPVVLPAVSYGESQEQEEATQNSRLRNLQQPGI